jgi:hypothetical protein
MGKSLPLESDEKDKCMNVKTLSHVASRCTKKCEKNKKSFMRMRKVLLDKDTCVEEIIILALEIFT